METPTDGIPSSMLQLPEGETVVLRPIRPDDAPRLLTMAEHLSPTTVYLRFFRAKRKLSPAEAAAFAQVDYRTRLAIVAERPTTPESQLIGVARYDVAGTGDPHAAATAVVVEDRYQHAGVGRALLQALAAAARANGITSFVGDVLAENQRMLDILRSSGLPLTLEQRDEEIHFAIDITAPR